MSVVYDSCEQYDSVDNMISYATLLQYTLYLPTDWIGCSGILKRLLVSVQCIWMVRREFFKELTGCHRLSCNSWDDFDGASVSACGILAVAAVMLYSVLLVVGISGIVDMLCGRDKKLLLVV